MSSTHSYSNKRSYWGYLWLFLFCALLSSPFVYWQVSPPRLTALKIVDKSVPNTKYREHEGLVWALNHLKYFPPGGKEWSYDKDYTGYYPVEGHPKDDTHEPLKAEHLAGKSILFLADTYGVYSADIKGRKDEANESNEGQDYSALIFGGISEDELGVIQDFGQRGGHIIAEFNTFASPTKKDVRKGMEDLLGVDWSGWAGRYFDNLSDMTEIPLWAPRKWKENHGKEWKFEGPGWIFIHEDSHLFVLEENKHIAPKGLKIKVDQVDDPLMENTYSDVPFYFWFDILTPQKGSEVLASYHANLTPEGKGLFNRYDIPESFPAVIRKQKKPLRLYFAGDFSDTGFSKGLYYASGRQPLESFNRFKEKMPTQEAFFWQFYVPLIDNTFGSILN